MRPPGPFHREAVDLGRARPALRGAQDQHRPARPLGHTAHPGVVLDAGDLVEDLVEDGRHRLVHDGGVVALDHIGPVPITLEEGFELTVGQAGENGRVGDLPPVQVQDRQHGTVVGRVQELVRMPGGGQRPGFRFTVADDASHQQVRVVEGRPIGVGEGVAEFSALVNRARRLRGHMAGDAAGERELPEQSAHPLAVAGDVRIDLAVGALQPRVGHHAGAPVSRPAHVHGVEIPLHDGSVEVGIDEVETRGRPPVAEETGLDVLRPQRLRQQRVVQQVDLPHREVIGRPPPGVERVEIDRGVVFEGAFCHVVSRGIGFGAVCCGARGRNRYIHSHRACLCR